MAWFGVVSRSLSTGSLRRHSVLASPAMRFAILACTLLLAACQSSDVSRSLGARCDKSSECDERCLPPSGEWPGGFCTFTCDSDADCPEGSGCVDEQGAGICAFRCGAPGDCTFLGEYVCVDRDRHGDTGNKAAVCRGA